LESKKILILGSEGFIGSHLVRYFLQKDYQVEGCDLFETSLKGNYPYTKVTRLSPEWEEIFTTLQPDVCINAAGSGNVPYSMQHPLSDFEANTLDTIRLLDVIRRFHSACKYLHISSAAVYGNPQSLPVMEQTPLHPLSPYGWHKFMSESICREYHELYGAQVVIVRPFSVYGNGLRKQLLWDLCKKMEAQDNVTLYGTGRESRDFIHIDDLCFLIDCVLTKSEFKSDIYNAGNGIQVYIETIAALVKQFFGSKKSIHFNGESRKGDPLNWEAEISKVKQLGYKPKVSLESGIKEYVSYFKGL
jgi:dTDP-glucose 4,6-dehydratase/UDP-glucose 4-epimerase